MARTRYRYRLVLRRLIVSNYLWTHQNFLRKVFLGFIPIFFSSWFYTAVGHVARYALLSCKETATKTSLGLKSKDDKKRSIYIMWGKLNGVRIAQSKTQSLLHGNTRKMSVWQCIFMHRDAWICNCRRVPEAGKKDAGILAVSYIFLYICRILAL